jgi:hypothetical protein
VAGSGDVRPQSRQSYCYLCRFQARKRRGACRFCTVPQYVGSLNSRAFEQHQRRNYIALGQTILHPLCFYIDKTGADKLQKNSLEPLVCTSSLLTAEARHDPRNWFVVGFVPNLELTSTARRTNETSKKRGKSSHARDFHNCLAKLLVDLLKLQRGKQVMLFRRGKEVGKFRIRCPISTVLGDNLSQNKLCAKIHNTHPSCPRM